MASQQSTLKSRPVASIIQGVSQQNARQRRDTQCEAQFDCINSPSHGVVPRPGFDLMNLRAGLTRSGAFTYELRRGLDEHYLMVLYQGTLEVYNLYTGTQCTVIDETGADGYLNPTVGVADIDNFRVQTIDDQTFIANRSKVPAYTAAVAPARPKEALVFFQAGEYLCTYSIAVKYGTTTYHYDYRTPDNSVAPNAELIRTNQLAATFYSAMTAINATAVANGGVGSGNMNGDTGGFGGGTPSVLSVRNNSTPVAVGNLAAAGFSVALNGNLLRIWREDGNDFTVDAADGQGDSALTAFKETAQALSALPKGGFDGFVLNIVGVTSGGSSFSLGGGASAGASAGYWVKYTGDYKGGGTWVECVKPGTHTTLDPVTMPHTIFCSAPNVFRIQKQTWLPRICGDAVNTALDPGFVGQKIQALSFYQSRLVILTESTVDFSKSEQPFTFFPDTVQTTLANGPISLSLAASETTALLRTGLVMDESLLLWAQLAQFRINSGQNPLQPDTVQRPQSTDYEFNEKANLAKAGNTLYFSYEDTQWSQVLTQLYQQGRASGPPGNVTEHVPSYIPAGVRLLSISPALNTMAVRTDGASSNLYFYNFKVEGQSVIQAAWNTWRLPCTAVLWQTIYRQTMYALLQRPEGVALVSLPLNLDVRDAGQTDYLTRLDLRIYRKGPGIPFSPDDFGGTTTFTLPYTLSVPEQALLRVVSAESTNIAPRGKLATLAAVTSTTVTVRGNWSDQGCYIGLRISAERLESEFFIRGQSGFTPTEILKVRKFFLNYEKSAYSRIEITQGSGQTKEAELFPNPVHQSVPELGASPAMRNGILPITCDTESNELSVKCVNDTHLPSRWTSIEWQYQATERAVPSMPGGQG